MSDAFFQMPPDSTGKKSTASARVSLNYTGHSPQVMSVGDVITGATSGAYGEVVRVTPDGGDVTIGVVDILEDVDSPTPFFVDGENLTIDGSTVAQADGNGELLLTQKIILSGSNNPFNGAFVDKRGALFVRNSEGSQQYDAFGLARGTSPTAIATYNFEYGIDEDVWQDVQTGGASYSHLTDSSSIALDVGIASGDICQITTNTYHRYQPGMGQMIEMTVSHGDAGKAGLVRQWGYFDDDDGIFFELDQSGTLNVVQRSSTSGSMAEQRVSQHDWNGDRVNGASGLVNLSGFDLDPLAINIYWIDFAWLGAGVVRMGIFDDGGGRIVCHSFQNPNSSPRPYMRTGSLPIRIRVENTSLTGSPSRTNFTCATVHSDGNLIPDRKRKSDKRSLLSQNVSSITTQVPLLSIRLSNLIGSIANRKMLIPEIFSFYTQDQPVRICLIKNSTLTGASWTPLANSTIEYDDSATSFSGGTELLSWVVDPGSHNFTAPPNFGIQGENLKILADASASETYTLCAESLSAAAQARANMTWIEVE